MKEQKEKPEGEREIKKMLRLVFGLVFFFWYMYIR